MASDLKIWKPLVKTIFTNCWIPNPKMNSFTLSLYTHINHSQEIKCKMRQIFTLLVSIFFLLQCHTSYNQTENKESDPAVDQTIVTTDDKPEVDEKWKLSARMLSYVRDMETEIVNHNTSQSLPVLTTNLQTLLAQMISNHNTKGKAGEALEEWMSNFKQLLERTHELSEQEAIEQLKMSIETFRESFHWVGAGVKENRHFFSFNLAQFDLEMIWL